jgi:hypothetical protein
MLIGPRVRTPTSKGAPAHRPSKGGSDQKSGQPGRTRGTGSSAGIRVKHKRATAKQRDVIDGCLSEADSDGASRRVKVAVVMALTQESRCGEDSSNLFQQTTAWNTAQDSEDPAKATKSFLVSGPTSWKKVNGGIKKASGSLANDIQRVQASGAGASAYAQWQTEAEQTVDVWEANDGGGSSEKTRRKRYEFTRGERSGQRENSWDASSRLVSEVGAYRWAAGNVFYAVSGDELRAGAPSLTIKGTEGWLVTKPSYGWANNRPVTEVVIDVLSEHWNVMPGGSVVLGPQFGPLAGRYYVWHVSGSRLDSPVVTMTLRRPTRLKDEPAAELVSVDTGGDASGSLHDIAQQISQNRSEYVYGGSHGPPLKKVHSSDHMDCSSSCSLALFRAGFFNGSVAITSGVFASSWGVAGKGDTFTVWANSTHVWIEGYDEKGDFDWRFDTSHHGGKSGPALETVKRDDQSRFTPRHWPHH